MACATHCNSPPLSPTQVLRAKLLISKAKRAKKSATKVAKCLKKATDETLESLTVASQPRVVVDWSNPALRDLMDKLLAAISDNSVYKVAFGFDKGTDSTVNSGGAKFKVRHESLAWKVFLLDPLGQPDPASPWHNHPIDKLGTSVKNRIKMLKELYGKYWGQLGETGQGRQEKSLFLYRDL
ncbi:hypothetical protein BV22DRAFT_1050308 [Leucogyrophana mollusca]|uniref:Uncharacterized protein n=1 Tax=Leucogyrophana mollusca TaxID=85980 RepID=A0ACB8B470_9AGAM|nr:hypothetical protein BV22DRAFT_1050308 [Leucogyrophana mollusca]